MHTKTITYSCVYQHSSNRSITKTRAGLMLDALDLAEHHGYLEVLFADHSASCGAEIADCEARRMDDMLDDVEQLGRRAIGRGWPRRG